MSAQEKPAHPGRLFLQWGDGYPFAFLLVVDFLADLVVFALPLLAAFLVAIFCTSQCCDVLLPIQLLVSSGEFCLLCRL
jgi:hypothetical protein